VKAKDKTIVELEAKCVTVKEDLEQKLSNLENLAKDKDIQIEELEAKQADNKTTIRLSILEDQVKVKDKKIEELQLQNVSFKKLEQQRKASHVEDLTVKQSHVKNLQVMKEERERECQVYRQNLTVLKNNLKERDVIISVLQWTELILSNKMEKERETQNERKNQIEELNNEISQMKSEYKANMERFRETFSQMKEKVIFITIPMSKLFYFNVYHEWNNFQTVSEFL
jgi:chromosome segregation ATPase